MGALMRWLEPHGMGREGQEHDKVQFHRTIKDIEGRLKDPHLRLESAIVTPTAFAQLQDRGLSLDDWNKRHVFFMAQKTPKGEPEFMGQVMGVLLR